MADIAQTNVRASCIIHMNFAGIACFSYIDHSIISNELQLLFKDKIAKIRDKVVYTSKNGRLEADVILLNLINKKAKILMNNSEEKIKISYLN